jgi:hypothetical protein
MSVCHVFHHTVTTITFHNMHLQWPWITMLPLILLLCLLLTWSPCWRQRTPLDCNCTSKSTRLHLCVLLCTSCLPSSLLCFVFCTSSSYILVSIFFWPTPTSPAAFPSVNLPSPTILCFPSSHLLPLSTSLPYLYLYHIFFVYTSVPFHLSSSNSCVPRHFTYLPSLSSVTFSLSVLCFCALPFKAQWELYVPLALTISNCAACIYGPCMSLS